MATTRNDVLPFETVRMVKFGADQRTRRTGGPR
jgi:hypothetical protein